jgi:hypothetical protein
MVNVDLNAMLHTSQPIFEEKNVTIQLQDKS